jgi:hypothetical protein
MNKIAHRGNTKGKTPHENMPHYISKAAEDYFVEIDVWYQDGRFFLGHDSPEYLVSRSFLQNDKFFCHAKNLAALQAMLGDPKIHCFWHQEDDVTITSRNFIWKYPEVYFQGELWGICSDYL